MMKHEFLWKLEGVLKALPMEERESLLAYYEELINDRMDDGMTEEQATDTLGPVEELAETILRNTPAQALAEIPPETEEVPRKAKRGIPLWAIILLILGSPLWISLGAAFLSCVLVFWLCIWIVAVTPIFVSGVCIFTGAIVALGAFIAPVSPATIAVRLLLCGSGLLCAGLGLMLLPLSLFCIRKCAGLFRLSRFFKKSGKEDAV